MAERTSQMIKLNKHEQQYPTHGGKTEEGNAYRKLGDVYYSLGESKQAIDYYQKCLSVAKEAGNRVREAHINCKLGDAYESLGNFKEAIECHKNNLSIVKEVGDSVGELAACSNIGNAYECLSDFKQAIEYHKQHLAVARELGDRHAEGAAHCNLGRAYHGVGDFKEAITQHNQDLKIAKELGDRAGEGTSYGNLGDAYERLGNFKQAMEYHKQHLTIAKEVKDRAGEGAAYCSLGRAHHGMGDFKKAVEYHMQHLAIAKEMGDSVGEGAAYCNLGNAYHRLCDFKQAIQYHEKDLNITREASDRAGEGTSYGNLGNSYHSMGDFKKAIEYHKLHLSIAKEVGDRAGEGAAYCNLSRAYLWTGDFKQAVEYQKLDLHIAKELKDRAGEGTSYGNLGNSYHNIGDFKKALEYHKLHLDIAKEVGDRAGEGRAYGNIGRAHHCLGDCEQALEYLYRSLSIDKEVGNRNGEGRAYGNLGRVFQSLGDYQLAITYHNQNLTIAREVGDKGGEGVCCGKLGYAFESLGESKKAMEYHLQELSIAKEVGNIHGEAAACYSLGRVSESTGLLHEALGFFRSSVRIYNSIRALFETEDACKVSFRNSYKDVYIALWRTLLKLQKTDEALIFVEQGRAQALLDLMRLQYDFGVLPSVSDESAKTLSDVVAKVSTQTLFVALESNAINFWVLCKANEIHFRRHEIEGDDGIKFLQCLKNNTESVILSLDDYEQRGDFPFSGKSGQENKKSSQDKNKPLRLLYDTAIGPIADLIHSDELIIVPDGPLCMVPYAASLDRDSRYLSEYVRIRAIPSLRCLKTITDCPEDYHSKGEVLLVGDPCIEEVTNQLSRTTYSQLPAARKEVELIGEILKTTPLIGSQATKDEVLKRIGSVALIHIAAHTEMDTADIILAPNTTRTLAKPTEQDYILKAEELQAVRLRARLVVLTCCQSGRGEVNSEGVVGIVRAFLGAGARSVLLSAWRVDGDATIELMRSFYQSLKEGNSASLALHQAMKCLRESDKFGAVKYWAPFALFGDDITIRLKGKEELGGLVR